MPPDPLKSFIDAYAEAISSQKAAIFAERDCPFPQDS